MTSEYGQKTKMTKQPRNQQIKRSEKRAQDDKRKKKTEKWLAQVKTKNSLRSILRSDTECRFADSLLLSMTASQFQN